jgi:WD40 repeat protein
VLTFQFTPEAILWRRIAFSPDGRLLALGGKSAFTLIDTTGERPPEELALGNWGKSFAFVRGGAFANMSKLDRLGVYDLRTKTTRRRIFRNGFARDMVAGRDGKTLYLGFAMLSGKFANRVSVVGTTDLKTRSSFGTVNDELYALTVSGDGRWLAVRGRRYIRLWRLGGPKWPSRPVACVKHESGHFALSNDGSRLATADGSVLTLWDAATGKPVGRSAKHRSRVTAVACSPVGPLLVTGDSAGKVFLWDAAGRVLTRYNWGLKEVAALAFAPDGLRAAAVDRTGKVVIWDVDL